MMGGLQNGGCGRASRRAYLFLSGYGIMQP
jgi:hypothetical protein